MKSLKRLNISTLTFIAASFCITLYFAAYSGLPFSDNPHRDWSNKRAAIAPGLIYANGDIVAFGTADKDIIIGRNFGIIAGDPEGETYIRNYKNRPALVFIFDDGYSSHFEEVAPLFEELHGRAAFGVVTGMVGAQGRLSEGELRNLQSRGFEILNHSSSHVAIKQPGLSEAVIQREIIESQKLLEGMELRIRGFVTPYSILHDQYEPTLRKSHDFGFTRYSDRGAVASSAISRYRLSRINTQNDAEGALSMIDGLSGTQKVLFLYDHDIGPSKTPLKRIERILRYASSSGLDIRTPSGALRLLDISNKSTCDYRSELNEDLTVSCIVAHDVEVSATLDRTASHEIAEFTRQGVSVQGSNVSIELNGCPISGFLKKVRKHIYSGELQGDCGQYTLYAARTEHALFMLLDSQDKMTTKVVEFSR